MSDSARLYAYKALFEAKRLVTRADMIAVAKVSHATFKRDIAKQRDQMGMPILFDKDRGGYFLDRNNLATEMPGLWFNTEELVALLTIQRLIEQLEPGLVSLKLRPLQKKLTDLLEAKGLGEAEIAKRLRLTFAGKRQLELKAFEQVALATISRKQIKITHLSRERAERVERTISPQELVHYRDNWYIDSCCHLRNGIRSFGLDAIENVQILDNNGTHNKWPPANQTAATSSKYRTLTNVSCWATSCDLVRMCRCWSRKNFVPNCRRPCWKQLRNTSESVLRSLPQFRLKQASCIAGNHPFQMHTRPRQSDK